MWEETLGFFVLLVPLALALHYDRMVAAAIIFPGAGVLASTVNPFSTGVASDAAGISIGDGIGLRLAMWFVLLTLAIGYVLWYALAAALFVVMAVVIGLIARLGEEGTDVDHRRRLRLPRRGADHRPRTGDHRRDDSDLGRDHGRAGPVEGRLRPLPKFVWPYLLVVFVIVCAFVGIAAATG